MALSEKLIDKRVLRRSLERGLIDKTEFESYLSSLPDLSGQVENAGSGNEPQRPDQPPTYSPVTQP